MPKENDNTNTLGGKDKNRGYKHQNKDKYKPKSVKDPRYVSRKIKRNLGSNWDRYETKEGLEKGKLSSSTDFSLLANAPISQGQHFLFKQDKLLIVEIDKTSQELFSLDLNMLKYSVLSVPFYKRVGVEQTYFTENQISFMNGYSEKNAIKYKEKYNCNTNVEKLLPDSGLKEFEEKNDVSQITSKMDYLVKLKVNENIKNAEDDLEKWLDNILDD